MQYVARKHPARVALPLPAFLIARATGCFHGPNNRENLANISSKLAHPQPLLPPPPTLYTFYCVFKINVGWDIIKLKKRNSRFNYSPGKKCFI